MALRLRHYKPCDAKRIVSWIKDEDALRKVLSRVFRKFIPKLNRLDCYVPGWAMPVKDARTTPVLDGQWADW